MRKFFTLVVLVAATLVAIPAQAQFKFGLKGGLNITDMSFSSDVLESSNRAGFFIGPTVKFTLPIVGLGVDASALYDQREAKVKGTDNKLKQQAINIPINIGDKHQTLIEDVSDWKLNTSNFSVNVGAGVMLLGHLQVGANYNIVCGKTGEVTVFDGVREVVRGRSNTWQISAAYYF